MFTIIQPLDKDSSENTCLYFYQYIVKNQSPILERTVNATRKDKQSKSKCLKLIASNFLILLGRSNILKKPRFFVVIVSPFY